MEINGKKENEEKTNYKIKKLKETKSNKQEIQLIKRQSEVCKIKIMMCPIKKTGKEEKDIQD